MITDFRLIGISKPRSAKITLLDNTTDTLDVTIEMSNEKVNQLFEYLTGDWETDKIAEVEHEKFNYDGFPINGKMIAIRDWDLGFKAPKL